MSIPVQNNNPKDNAPGLIKCCFEDAHRTAGESALSVAGKRLKAASSFPRREINKLLTTTLSKSRSSADQTHLRLRILPHQNCWWQLLFESGWINQIQKIYPVFSSTHFRSQRKVGRCLERVALKRIGEVGLASKEPSIDFFFVSSTLWLIKLRRF